MKEKTKGFLKKHEEEFKALGFGVAVGTTLLITGKVCYLAGQYSVMRGLYSKFGGGLGRVLSTAMHSKDLYGEILGPETVKVKDVGELTKRMIEFDSSHLEDEITGFFVFTNRK